MSDEIRTTKTEAEQAYELDLDEHTATDLEGAFEEAVAAVARGSDPDGDEDELVADETEDDPDATSSRAADLADQLERTVAERDTLRDRLQRTLADLDNFRKRTEREKQTLTRMGHFDFLKDFLGVIDNLERAMAASGSIDDLKHGLELVMKQQGEILRRHGVQAVEAVGQPFDPAVHDAVAREESGEVDTPTVCDELQKGYLLYDRLLRPAMVRVAVPAVSSSPSVDGSEEGEEGDAGE